jgi:hypothetical protein
MTTPKNTGGQAFPRPVSENRKDGDLPDGNRVIPEQNGMTLRDYFAAKAMQGLAASDFDVDPKKQDWSTAVAGMSYALADAMIAALESKLWEAEAEMGVIKKDVDRLAGDLIETRAQLQAAEASKAALVKALEYHAACYHRKYEEQPDGRETMVEWHICNECLEKIYGPSPVGLKHDEHCTTAKALAATKNHTSTPETKGEQ